MLVTVEGRPTGYLVVYHDVTALRAQHEAERRYRQLVEQLPLVTYVDEAVPVASSIYVSPQVEGLLGYPPEDWLADPSFFPKLLHPDDREWVLADLARILAAGMSSWALEYRLMARDGRTVLLRDEASVERDEDGTARYVQGFLIDITERKRAENALRRSEAEVRRQKQFFQSLLEHIDGDRHDRSRREGHPGGPGGGTALRVHAGGGVRAQRGRPCRPIGGAARRGGGPLPAGRHGSGSAPRHPSRARKDGTLVDVEIRPCPVVVAPRSA